MHAAVVKFNSLADTVRASTQNHDLAVFADADLVRCVVCRVIISCILDAADRYGIPRLCHACAQPLFTNVFFRNVQNLREVAVSKSVFFGLDQKIVWQRPALTCKDFFFQFDELLHLFDKPFFDEGFGMKGIHGSALAQRFVHDKLPLTGRFAKHLHQLIQRSGVEIFCKAQAVALFLQGANRFLQGFLVILANAHDFAHGSHLCAQFIGRTGELFKIPPREFNHDVIARRSVFIQCPLTPVGDFIQGDSRRQYGGNQSDRETGCLGSQR